MDETSHLGRNISLSALCSTQYLATKSSSSALFSSQTWGTSRTLENQTLDSKKKYVVHMVFTQLNQCAFCKPPDFKTGVNYNSSNSVSETPMI